MSTKYSLSAAKVREFNRIWPGSIIPEKRCWFEFDRKGNLLDMSPHLYEFDSYELLILSEDAPYIGREVKP